jgi:hypothetical protein
MKTNGNKSHPLSHYPDMKKSDSFSPEQDQKFAESFHDSVRMKKYGPFSSEKDEHFASHELIGRLDKIEAWMENQNGLSKSLQADASSTNCLIQDLCHQVDRISERLEPHWDKETTSAPSTPVKEATFPPETSAPKAPIRPQFSNSTQCGGASPNPAAVAYGTPSSKGVWYGVRMGLNGCKLVTNSWSVCQSVTKDASNTPFRGVHWNKFETAAAAYAFIES